MDSYFALGLHKFLHCAEHIYPLTAPATPTPGPMPAPPMALPNTAPIPETKPAPKTPAVPCTVGIPSLSKAESSREH